MEMLVIYTLETGEQRSMVELSEMSDKWQLVPPFYSSLIESFNVIYV